MSAIKIYTDGACTNNGTTYSRAGIGVYFGPNDPRNVSERVTGKQTNQTAEITAMIRALQIIGPTNEKAVIFTDSMYVYNWCTKWGKTHESEGWARKVQNKDLIREMIGLYKQYKTTITLRHIRAHQGKINEDSLGNEEADALAKEGARITGKCGGGLVFNSTDS